MVFSNSIIGSHYKELGFTYFNFTLLEKCVTIGQVFHSKFLLSCVREKPAFPNRDVPIVKRNEFLKLKTLWPLFMDGFNCFKARATSRRQFTFYK